jgi:hypothetical protein
VYFTIASFLALSRNQSVLTAGPSVSETLINSTPSSNGSTNSLSWTGDVQVGDVIRMAAGTVPGASNNTTATFAFQEQQIQVSVSNTLPQFSESDSSVRLSGANGFGSTATTTRRFASVLQNLGTDIEYTDSPTLGGQFKAMTSGIYNVSYSESSVANSAFSDIFILLNGTIIAFDNQVYNTAAAIDKYINVAWSGYLTAGDIITGVCNVAANNTGTSVRFTMSKVGKPNVTGVNVTPFIQIPQPLTQSITRLYTGRVQTGTYAGALTTESGTGILSYNSTTGLFTVLKKSIVNISFTGSNNVANGPLLLAIIVDGANGAVNSQEDDVVAGSYLNLSSTLEMLPGQTFYTYNYGGNSNLDKLQITATAQSDNIVTAIESFSTDTAPLTYAGSGSYTLATLANAPVGTFITYTYAINTNTRTQTTTAPTQTTADMQANGMLIYTRAYNAASTAAQPAAIAVQIGKGFKGKSIDLYKAAAKVTGGELDFAFISTTKEYGCFYQDYNEVTGILVIDAGYRESTANTSHTFQFSDISGATSGYLVINASKNPALAGVGIERVAARGVNTSGQSIPATTLTTVTYDAAKTYDTHGALNVSTGIFTAPVTGYYQANANILFASSAWAVGTYVDVYFIKNGAGVGALVQRSTVLGATSFNHVGSASGVIYLNKGDTLHVALSQLRGSPTLLETSAGYNTFSVAKISGIN